MPSIPATGVIFPVAHEINGLCHRAHRAHRAHLYPYSDMKPLRRLIRLALLSLHLLAGVVEALILDHDTAAPAFLAARQRWHARACRILGLKIRVTGRPPSLPSFHVANHISWLDIPVLGALSPVTFLSKSDVRQWPVIGWFAVRAGTLFIERGGKDASSSAATRIASVLDEGVSVVVFPEGTTSDGSDVHRFHPRLFAVAVQTGRPIQPVAVRYLDKTGRPHPTAPFIGDDRFPAHLWRLLGEESVRVKVTYCPPIETTGAGERRGLAEAARDCIAAAVSGRAGTENAAS